LPPKAAGTDAVGERKEDRDAATRRPAVGEEGRVGVEQLQLLLVPLDRPAEAVEAERRPDLGEPAVTVAEGVDGGVAAGHSRLRARLDGKGHGAVSRLWWGHLFKPQERPNREGGMRNGNEQ